MAVDMLFVPAAALTGRDSARKAQSSKEIAEEMAILKERDGILRCPVANCYRVAPTAPKVIKKRCPRCGKESDAPYSRKHTYDHRCIACMTKQIAKNEQDRHRREAKKRAMTQGSV